MKIEKAIMQAEYNPIYSTGPVSKVKYVKKTQVGKLSKLSKLSKYSAHSGHSGRYSGSGFCTDKTREERKTTQSVHSASFELCNFSKGDLMWN